MSRVSPLQLATELENASRTALRLVGFGASDPEAATPPDGTAPASVGAPRAAPTRADAGARVGTGAEAGVAAAAGAGTGARALAGASFPKVLAAEVGDIVAWAQMGLYFSSKLRGAVAFARYVNPSGMASEAMLKRESCVLVFLP